MNRRVAIAAIRRLTAGVPETDQDLVAVESPLPLDVSQPSTGATRTLGVLMRTPGDDVDLVLGLLYSEGIIARQVDVLTVTIDDGAHVTLAPHVDLDPQAAFRALAPTSACGLCGRLAVPPVDRAPGRAPDRPMLSAAMIASLPGQLRRGQTVFEETGGLHAAAVFTASGDLRLLREDVGRHNAVDKTIGALFQAGDLPASDAVLAVSGRVAYEIVQKAAAAGLAAVVAVGAPSSLAVDAARAAALTLVGFARDGRFNVYAGDGRLTA